MLLLIVMSLIFLIIPLQLFIYLFKIFTLVYSTFIFVSPNLITSTPSILAYLKSHFSTFSWYKMQQLGFLLVLRDDIRWPSVLCSLHWLPIHFGIHLKILLITSSFRSFPILHNGYVGPIQAQLQLYILGLHPSGHSRVKAKI